MEEMMKLDYTMKKETAKQAWIGLQSGGTGKWQWSLADQTFYRDTYRNWNSGEPNSDRKNAFCAYMYKYSGRWYDVPCDEPLSFVCYEETNTSTNRFILINEKKTWREAQTYCRENHTDLVSVRNQTENEEIRGMMQNSSYWDFSIGLFHDFWEWSDQSNSSFRYWRSNKPSGGLNCAAVSVSEPHYWSDVSCIEKLPFICHENRLILIKQNLTWRQALNYCRNHHYDLVSVRTEEMQFWVKEVVQDASTEQVWLGLSHDCAQRIWFWVFGTMVCYQDWAPGNGTWNEDCSHEKRSGAVQSRGQQQWIDMPQSYKLNFICSIYNR
ncbi:macrophage mannose receptor 1-like isoform X2 [Neoarius graeffei]|nr:macrophage mannose receptor 1-like isoform X2 [Neoarius graeffei]XP_060755396.1 macrophage mannose receptor 1-like isoform X2 [Neoarius graeffei]